MWDGCWILEGDLAAGYWTHPDPHYGMTDTAPLAALGWLVFAVGVGVMLIALLPRKSQVRSPTRRAAGATSGLVFCLLAAIVIVPGLSGGAQRALAIAAAVAGAVSWYLGRHAHKMDRMARRAR